MAAKIILLGLILSSHPYRRSAMIRFPLVKKGLTIKYIYFFYFHELNVKNLNFCKF